MKLELTSSLPSFPDGQNYSRIPSFVVPQRLHGNSTSQDRSRWYGMLGVPGIDSLVGFEVSRLACSPSSSLPSIPSSSSLSLHPEIQVSRLSSSCRSSLYCSLLADHLLAPFFFRSDIACTTDTRTTQSTIPTLPQEDCSSAIADGSRSSLPTPR